jgi:hypothetical protein
MIIVPLITCSSYKNISLNMSKIYLSIIIGLLIVLGQIYSFDILNRSKSKMHYIIYISLLIIYIYLYRKQLVVDDLNFLKDIKEKNSSLMLIAQRKSKNNKINSFSTYIYNRLNKENEFIDKIM